METTTTSNVTVDNTATKEQVAELYIATFGRAPDASGLEYWTNEVATGSLTLDGVAKSFFEQEEAQTMYGNSSNEDFVISVYANALGREVTADDSGVQYWVSELNADQYSKDGFIKTVLDGAKAETGSANDAALLENRVSTGLLYAEEIGVADSPLAKQVMDKVTADKSTAEDAKGSISYYKDWVSKYDTALGDTVDKDELYSHIDDNSYWTELEQTHELNFDSAPTVKFWEQDDALWEKSVSLDKDVTFDFLDNEKSWADTSKYESFHSGEFSKIDVKSIFDSNDTKEEEKVDTKEEVVTPSETDIKHVTDEFSNGSTGLDVGSFISFKEVHNDDYSYTSNGSIESNANVEITETEISGVTTVETSSEVIG